MAKTAQQRAERRTDNAYAVATWPITIGHTPIFFLAAYLNHVTGVSLAVLGLISTIGRVYDALFNPVIGVVSDHTRTRFGRRKPWVAIGMVVMCGVLLLGVLTLPDGSKPFSGLWFGGGLILFFTAWTTALVAYNAHAGEITTNYDRRTRMNLVQSQIEIVASLLTYLIPYLLVDPDMSWLRQALAAMLPPIGPLTGVQDFLRSEALTGVANYGRVMMILAALTILSMPILLWRYLRRVPELPIPPEIGERRSKTSALLLPLRNPVFRRFCAGYLLFIAGYVGRLSLYPFVVPYATAGGYSFLLLMQIQGIAGILATPIWMRVFMKLERGQLMLVAACIEAAGLVCLGLSTQGMPILTLVGAALIGLPGGTVGSVPFLVASECSDHTRLKLGGDTRGLHTSLIATIGKIGSFLATMVLGIAGALGFNPAKGVSAEDVIIVQMLGLYIPAALILMGGVVMLGFPITRSRHRAILNRLERREAAVALAGTLPPISEEPPAASGLLIDLAPHRP